MQYYNTFCSLYYATILLVLHKISIPNNELVDKILKNLSLFLKDCMSLGVERIHSQQPKKKKKIVERILGEDSIISVCSCLAAFFLNSTLSNIPTFGISHIEKPFYMIQYHLLVIPARCLSIPTFIFLPFSSTKHKNVLICSKR